MAVQKRHIAVNQGNTAVEYLSFFPQISLPSYICVYIAFKIKVFSVAVAVLSVICVRRIMPNPK